MSTTPTNNTATASAFIEDKTIFLPVNGHRWYIDEMAPVLETLKREGWNVAEPRVYPDPNGNTDRDYISILVYRTFH